jgi:hypothetical protein
MQKDEHELYEAAKDTQGWWLINNDDSICTKYHIGIGPLTNITHFLIPATRNSSCFGVPMKKFSIHRDGDS